MSGFGRLVELSFHSEIQSSNSIKRCCKPNLRERSKTRIQENRMYQRIPDWSSVLTSWPTDHLNTLLMIIVDHQMNSRKNLWETLTAPKVHGCQTKCFDWPFDVFIVQLTTPRLKRSRPSFSIKQKFFVSSFPANVSVRLGQNVTFEVRFDWAGNQIAEGLSSRSTVWLSGLQRWPVCFFFSNRNLVAGWYE